MLDVEPPTTHTEMWGGPFVELAGDSRGARTAGRNRDAYITANLRRHLVLGPSSSAVCEGMPRYGGTHSKLLAIASGRGGDASRASWCAVDTLADFVAHRTMWAPELDEAAEIRVASDLEAAFATCHDRILELDCEDACAALTAIYINWPRAFVAHVGNSRAYLYRERRLRRLTADHTVAGRISQRGIGVATPADGLTMALGASDDVPAVEMASFELLPGDQLLLCSAGLPRQVSEFEIARALNDGTTAAGACRRLIDRAASGRQHWDVTTVIARAAAEDRFYG